MKLFKFIVILLILLSSVKDYAQHRIVLKAEVDLETKIIAAEQELDYYNDSDVPLNAIVLNDWNNAYSAKDTPLARRFSDEFTRSFHLANDEERGNTNILSIIGPEYTSLHYTRPPEHPDLVLVTLQNPVMPHQRIRLKITYLIKIPSDRFTRYGYNSNGEMNLKDWFLMPARFQDQTFTTYSNENLDDAANAASDYTLLLTVPKNKEITSDLNQIRTEEKAEKTIYTFEGKNRHNFSLVISPFINYSSYKNTITEVVTDIKSNRVTEIQKAILIDKIVLFVNDNVGGFPHEKITVSQLDYDRDPFYGLNQLPAFLAPFSDDFLYEIKFLKTYTNNFLKSSLQLDPRKENWIYDGLQMYLIIKYIEENHPDMKMMGNISKFKLLKSFYLTNIEFNGQFNYLYLLMARKNLDQPIGDAKTTFIKFNEQIAGKYKAGLSFNYLDQFLGDATLTIAITDFYSLNKKQQTTEYDFETILKSRTDKNIDWFFNTLVHSRELIDYRFGNVVRSKDSLTVTVENNQKATVPISLYGFKNGKIVFKEWLENIKTDSTFTIPRNGADKLALNYTDEVPEYNQRNNWKSLKGFFVPNRPIKFNLMKDLEHPYYNQIFYVPDFEYNLYDGLALGMRLHNKSLLDKPFSYDVTPIFSFKTQSLIGSASVAYNQQIRDSRLYNIRYGMSSSYYHYAPDAAYLKLTPSVTFRFREENLRNNKKRFIGLRYVMVDREKSIFTMDKNNENYSVLDIRYGSTKTEVTNHFSFLTDVQVSNAFGKFSGQLEYRHLFDNNRQVNLRFYGGTFLYRKTDSDFFSFATDRPTDYLFDYNYYGRSESSGLFSQQLIIAEGGFKSKLDIPYANQWITTVNGSFNIWNWIELYGDAGMVKNKYSDPKFIYDSGIRLNLVTDYFELYFPVYSSNGWEIAQPNYNEKIRFIVTISPGTLLNLFTRKWL
ncbi:aminopeptidase [Flavobacterium kingsejongi]|uniref:aminopeptidase n=1 Tax=Flavobacterium kingsejongi TaxID=1678728 RepID=UPI001D130BF0|nr:aminopeptidase [Flavobacterium kingsejongi]